MKFHNANHTNETWRKMMRQNIRWYYDDSIFCYCEVKNVWAVHNSNTLVKWRESVQSGHVWTGGKFCDVTLDGERKQVRVRHGEKDRTKHEGKRKEAVSLLWSHPGFPPRGSRSPRRARSRPPAPLPASTKQARGTKIRSQVTAALNTDRQKRSPWKVKASFSFSISTWYLRTYSICVQYCSWNGLIEPWNVLSVQILRHCNGFEFDFWLLMCSKKLTSSHKSRYQKGRGAGFTQQATVKMWRALSAIQSFCCWH